MSIVHISTHFNIELEFEAAPFHRRLIAWGIDLFVQIIYLIIAMKFLSWMEGHTKGFNKDAAYNFWAIGLVLMLPFFLYHVVCEATLNGQSIGKRLMNVRVVNENGGKASLSQYIIRWLIRTSDYTALIIILYAPYMVVYGLAVYWAVLGSVALLATDVFLTAAGKKNQRIGDILAHTLVIKANQKNKIEDTIFLQVATDYQPSFPEVMRLSDRDINALKSIWQTSLRQHDYPLAEHAAEKIKSHLNIQTSLSAFDFLETLLKDYNYLAAA